jgi:tetratricopeptide (TPR) repeat protein
MRECVACGSPLKGDPLNYSWTCEYCKTVTYNEAFLRQRIASLDFSKSHNLLQVGLAAYNGGDYGKAIEILERVLTEDSENVDAWVYTALSTALLANISNYERSANKVESYLNKAATIAPESDVFVTGKNVCANVLGLLAVRMVDRQFEEGKKTWFCYESTDRTKADQKANEEYNIGLKYAEHAFLLNPDDSKISGRLAVLVLLIDQRYSGSNPYGSTVSKALSVLNDIKTKNPSLYAEYGAMIEPPKKQKSGCAGQAIAILAALGASALLVMAAIVSI